MNLKQARYMTAISQCGSITAASKKLFVSQPYLSQMLKQIEEELGVTLFDRSVSPFRVTYAGELYLAAAKKIISVNTELENQLSEVKHESTGRIRLGISVSRAMQVLPLVLPKFSAQYPNVVLDLTESGSAKLYELLQSGSIDLALAAIETTSTDLTYELIENETMGILAGHNTYLAQNIPSGTPITLEQAGNDKFVYLTQGHSARVVQDQLFHKSGFKPQKMLETNSLEVGRRVALGSGACMLLPNIYVDSHVRQMNGAFFPLKDYHNHRHFYACYRKGGYLPQYTRDFIQLTAERLSAMRTHSYAEFHI